MKRHSSKSKEKSRRNWRSNPKNLRSSSKEKIKRTILKISALNRCQPGLKCHQTIKRDQILALKSALRWQKLLRPRLNCWFLIMIHKRICYLTDSLTLPIVTFPTKPLLLKSENRLCGAPSSLLKSSSYTSHSSRKLTTIYHSLL